MIIEICKILFRLSIVESQYRKFSLAKIDEPINLTVIRDDVFFCLSLSRFSPWSKGDYFSPLGRLFSTGDSYGNGNQIM